MTTPKQERNKQNLERLFREVFTRGNIELTDELVTPDRPDHEPNLPPEMTRDREGLKLFLRVARAGFPDLKLTSNFMVAEEDMVVSYNTMEGTHAGEFMGMPPTGKKFQILSADFCRFNEEGKIAEHWGVIDFGGMMRQLGAGAPA